jgi:hypothetical protein
VLLNLAILVVSGLSEVLGALGQILLSYLVHLHSSLRSMKQGKVHVGPITLLENPPCSYAFLDNRHALIHLYMNVRTLSKNMLEASSYGPYQTL